MQSIWQPRLETMLVMTCCVVELFTHTHIYRLQQASHSVWDMAAIDSSDNRFLSSVNSVNWNNVWDIRIKREREYEQQCKIIDIDMFTISTASQYPLPHVQNNVTADSVFRKFNCLHNLLQTRYNKSSEPHLLRGLDISIWSTEPSILPLNIYNLNLVKQM
jgi:hypothetical protein